MDEVPETLRDMSTYFFYVQETEALKMFCEEKYEIFIKEWIQDKTK